MNRFLMSCLLAMSLITGSCGGGGTSEVDRLWHTSGYRAGLSICQSGGQGAVA
jgi:hypothetical protein